MEPHHHLCQPRFCISSIHAGEDAAFHIKCSKRPHHQQHQRHPFDWVDLLMMLFSATPNSSTILPLGITGVRALPECAERAPCLKANCCPCMFAHCLVHGQLDCQQACHMCALFALATIVLYALSINALATVTGATAHWRHCVLNSSYLGHDALLVFIVILFRRSVCNG